MRQRFFILIAGMAMGMALLSGGTALASTVLTATPSSQTFYINGRQVTMTAYLIGGSNYVRLRDIGQAVGFNVYWDGTVQVESGKPYTGTAPASQSVPPTQQAPTALTEESVRATIRALRDTYFPYTTNSSGFPDDRPLYRPRPAKCYQDTAALRSDPGKSYSGSSFCSAFGR